MRLQFSQRSNKDLERLFKFLTQNAQHIKTADKALSAIKSGAISLLENPNAGTELQDDTGRRELHVYFGKNNYTLRYKPDFEANVIRILRIWHSREDRR